MCEIIWKIVKKPSKSFFSCHRLILQRTAKQHWLPWLSPPEDNINGNQNPHTVWGTAILKKKKSCKKVLKLPCSCSTDLGGPLGFGSLVSYTDTATQRSPSQHQAIALGKTCFLLLTLPSKPPSWMLSVILFLKWMSTKQPPGAKTDGRGLLWTRYQELPYPAAQPTGHVVSTDVPSRSLGSL